MNTLGSYLKEARLKKNLKPTDIESTIKVKAQFVSAIENHKWKELPDFPVVTGFVKNYADYLGLDKHKALALLRRDYGPRITKDLRKDSKKEPVVNFSIGPKITFFVGILSVVLLIGGYLLYQYLSFTSPPELIIRTPQENQTVFEEMLVVSGKTSSDATIRVNNQPAIIDADGNFEAGIILKSGEQEITIEAINRSDKITRITRKINFNKDG